MSRLFVVSLWFQLIWIVAVLGQENWQWLTAILGLATLGYVAKNDKYNLKKILLLGVIGVGLDSLNALAGLLVFKQSYVPVWLGVLWISFIWYATQWAPYLRKYNKAGIIVFVGCCGAMSYWAGYRLSAVQFSFPLYWTLLVLAVQWCCISWLIMKVFANGYSNSINSGDVRSATRNKD